MITPLDEFTKKQIGRLLAKTVSQYFKEEEHRREFEAWYISTYGAKYQMNIRERKKHERSENL